MPTIYNIINYAVFDIKFDNTSHSKKCKFLLLLVFLRDVDNMAVNRMYFEQDNIETQVV